MITPTHKERMRASLRVNLHQQMLQPPFQLHPQNVSTSANATCPDGAMWKFFTLRLRMAVEAP